MLETPLAFDELIILFRGFAVSPVMMIIRACPDCQTNLAVNKSACLLALLMRSPGVTIVTGGAPIGAPVAPVAVPAWSPRRAVAGDDVTNVTRGDVSGLVIRW